jgi:peptidyl-prolyl cis-trans isomerase SurA
MPVRRRGRERADRARPARGRISGIFAAAPARLAVPALLCLLGFAPPLRSELIDRIAVSVGNRVIATSDLDREIRVTAFLNGKRPDFSPAAKRKTAERMVEQQLIRRDLENSRYPSATPEEVQPALDKFKAAFYPSPADYQRALSAAGITGQDVIDALIWQRDLLEFVDIRFRPGVQVTEQQIQDYFDKVVKLALETAQPGKPAELADYRASIEETLVGAQVDREIDEWLKKARERTEIVFHDEALQ